MSDVSRMLRVVLVTTTVWFMTVLWVLVASAQEGPLSGRWEGVASPIDRPDCFADGTPNPVVIDVLQTGNAFHAVIVTQNKCVPAGNILFFGHFTATRAYCWQRGGSSVYPAVNVQSCQNFGLKEGRIYWDGNLFTRLTKPLALGAKLVGIRDTNRYAQCKNITTGETVPGVLEPKQVRCDHLPLAAGERLQLTIRGSED